MQLCKQKIFWIGVISLEVLGACGAYLYTGRVATAQAANSDEAELQIVMVLTQAP
jgi:hypothetical protein